MTTTPVKATFPAPDQSPWFNPENGLTYEYNGWGWDVMGASALSVKSEDVELSNPGTDTEGNAITNQAEFNKLAVSENETLKETVDGIEKYLSELGVTISEEDPVDRNYDEGELYWNSSADDLSLYIRVTDDDEGLTWVPASPPVSLEGVEASISDLDAQLQGTRQALQILNYQSVQQTQLAKEDQERQDAQIIELEEEINSLAPSIDRGKWSLVASGSTEIGPGQYAMGLDVDHQYCEEKYFACLADIEGGPDADVAAAAECNRLMGVCSDSIKNGEFILNDWAHARFLHFHKEDSDGSSHTFEDYKVGEYVDIFNQSNDDYAVFQITEAANIVDDIITIGVTPTQHRGEASGLARIKVFELASGDESGYIRKGTAEQSVTEYLRGTRLYFRGTGSDTDKYSFIEIGESAWLKCAGSMGLTAVRAESRGLFSGIYSPPEVMPDDWVPPKKYLDKNYAKTTPGKEVTLFVQDDILYAEWDS